MKNLMTEEEFNSLYLVEQNAISNEVKRFEGYGNPSWINIVRHCNLSESTLRKFVDRFGKDAWIEVSCHPLSEKFIDDFKQKLEWADVSQYTIFTKEQLIKYIDYIDWDRAPIYQKNVDEEVIDAVMASPKKDEFSWHGALVNVKMSEAFIEKYADEITKADKWEIVSWYQTLSEEFIEKYKDKLDWNYISQKQQMNRNFMIKHYDKINPVWCKRYQKNWDEEIEKEYNFIKTMNNPNFLTELKAVFTKYGYDYNIFNAMKNTLK